MSLNIVLSYQNSAPQSFKDGMQAAANILDALILNNITVNIQVTYDTSLGTSAEGEDLNGGTVAYSTLRNALAVHRSRYGREPHAACGIRALSVGADRQMDEGRQGQPYRGRGLSPRNSYRPNVVLIGARNPE